MEEAFDAYQHREDNLDFATRRLALRFLRESRDAVLLARAQRLVKQLYLLAVRQRARPSSVNASSLVARSTPFDVEWSAKAHARHLVPAPMVRLFARPYIAGSDMAAALDTAAELLETRRMLASLDLLGEAVSTVQQAEGNERVYHALIEAIAADRRFQRSAERPTVSLKPSAFCVSGDQLAAFTPIRRLTELARQREIRVTVDMEDHGWTDVTLQQAVGLYAKGYDVGTVLQTRLDRHHAGSRLHSERNANSTGDRHLSGAGDIATTDKDEMKRRLLEAAQRLLKQGAFVEFATHDEEVLQRFVQEIAPLGPDRCEIQHLLGVPVTSLQDRIRVGAFGQSLPVRLYVPFAVSWDDATAYLRRRMAESPNIVLLALRNLVTPDR